jgi:dolichol-phosphate mannosyltransferase
VIAVAFFSGIQLLSLGVMGEYIGRIYDEARQRPKYIVESRHGWDELELAPVDGAAGGDRVELRR